jgi:GNAT superfamily N-acetyltransferase
MAPVEYDDVAIRALTGDAADMADLQRVLEAAPTFAQRVTGVPPGAAEAQSTYTILPEGKRYDDKFVFGIYVAGEMVGCADLIRGYPDARTATLGLLLVAEPHKRRGVGRAACRLIENAVRAWGTCDRIRIGVVGTNADVMPFWRRQGYAATAEVKPYRYGGVVSEVTILVKPIAPCAGAQPS